MQTVRHALLATTALVGLGLGAAQAAPLAGQFINFSIQDTGTLASNPGGVAIYGPAALDVHFITANAYTIDTVNALDTHSVPGTPLNALPNAYVLDLVGQVIQKNWTIGAFTYAETVTVSNIIKSPVTESVSLIAKGTLLITSGTDSIIQKAQFTAVFTQVGGAGNAIDSSFTNASTVPEPASMLLLGAGLLGFGLARRRRG